MKRVDLVQTLTEPDRAGIFQLPAAETPAINEAARANGFPCLRVNLSGCTDKAEVLIRFAEALQFPDWFGHNWDALADCLTDLSWTPAAGYVLLIEHSQVFRAAAGDDLDTLIEILSEASASWAGLGVPFWAFITTSP